MCLELFLSKMKQKVYNTKVLYSISSIFWDFGQKPVSILEVSFGYVWGIIWCGFEIDMRFLRLSLKGGREKGEEREEQRRRPIRQSWRMQRAGGERRGGKERTIVSSWKRRKMKIPHNCDKIDIILKKTPENLHMWNFCSTFARFFVYIRAHMF